MAHDLIRIHEDVDVGVAGLGIGVPWVGDLSAVWSADSAARLRDRRFWRIWVHLPQVAISSCIVVIQIKDHSGSHQDKYYNITWWWLKLVISAAISISLIIVSRSSFSSLHHWYEQSLLTRAVSHGWIRKTNKSNHYPFSSFFMTMSSLYSVFYSTLIPLFKAVWIKVFYYFPF